MSLENKFSHYIRTRPSIRRSGTYSVVLLACVLFSIGCEGRRLPQRTLVRSKPYHSNSAWPYDHYEVLLSDTSVWQGVHVLYYPDNRIMSLTMYEASIPEGAFLNFREDGTIERRGMYLRGKRSGLQYRYHGNGRIAQVAEFRDDRLWNLLYQLDTSGVELECGTLEDGNGGAKFYHKNGSIAEEGEYVDGLREGTWKRYGMQRSLMETVVYHMGYTITWDGDTIRAGD